MNKKNGDQKYNDYRDLVRDWSVAEINKQQAMNVERQNELDAHQEVDMLLKEALNKVKAIREKYACPRRDLKIKSRILTQVKKEKVSETAPQLSEIAF